MRRGLATAALVALLVIDAVLVAVALRPGGLHGPPAGTAVATQVPGSTASTPTTTGPPTRTSGPTGAPTTPTATPRPTTSAPTNPTTATATATPVALLVAGVDASTAYRGATGTCRSGGATLEVTTDGGATWTTLRPPVRALPRVQPLDSARVFVIGSSGACEPRQYASRDRGSTWQAPAAVTGSWARRLDDPASILAPRATDPKPCGGATVVDLSRTSATRAQALCAGGEVVGSSDGGLTWRAEGAAAGGVALSNLDDSGVVTYVARVVGACGGVQVVRVETDRSTVVACVGSAAPRDGRVALSVTPQAGWLVVGDQTWSAAGDLRSWREV
ncbi:hypothetical protein [Intrasporangium sp. YIM S08009]|uniref:hypothetical protein n=1 Tax=Intrasporangium zincisolvens TaxID=3080018 RepID=UPI002B05828A|nr:hypothetical protein [Intrasporangium sp. YIM S08009]